MIWRPFRSKDSTGPINPPNENSSGFYNMTVEPQKPKPKKKAVKKKPTNKKKKVKSKPTLTPKEEATLAGLPYVSVTKIDLEENMGNGSIDLDWNDKFVINLIKQGYKIREDDTDTQIVDRWLQTICRNIALEFYEQEQADPSKRANSEVRIVQTKDLGGGFSEVS